MSKDKLSDRKNKIPRRSLLKRGFWGGVSFGFAPVVLKALPSRIDRIVPNGLEKRPFGSTGEKVTIMGLGGAPTGKLPDEKNALEIIHRLYELGVRYFDTAAAGAYGLSETRYGKILEPYRKEIFLATKTRHRSSTQAQIDFAQSFSKLKTDYFDLYQIHNITAQDDLDFAFGPKGVMELVVKARKEGKIRFVGVTGHTTAELLLKALDLYPYDAILMPLNCVGLNRNGFEKEVLPVARKRNIAIIGMKVFGAGSILRSGAANMEECLRYSAGLPLSTMILGCSTAEMAEQDARVLSTMAAMTEQERREIIKRTQPDR